MAENAKIIDINNHVTKVPVGNIIDELKLICEKYKIDHNIFSFEQKGKSTYLNIRLSKKL